MENTLCQRLLMAFYYLYSTYESWFCLNFQGKGTISGAESNVFSTRNTGFVSYSYCHQK